RGHSSITRIILRVLPPYFRQCWLSEPCPGCFLRAAPAMACPSEAASQAVRTRASSSSALATSLVQRRLIRSSRLNNSSPGAFIWGSQRSPTLPRAPSQGRCNGIIPHRAHGGAGDSRNPPEGMLLVKQQGRNADVGDPTKTADQCERQKPAHQIPSAEATVPVSQPIIKCEITDHRDAGCRSLA